MDLSGGYHAYVQQRRAAKEIRKCANRLRRMEQEVGPIQFVTHSTDAEHLSGTIALKSRQYQSTGGWDLFGSDWICSLLERIHAAQTTGFAGMLSLLFAGERLIAGHFGMRSRTIWHYWFPAYDKEMARFSPGLILLLKMAERANSLGLTMIDLGMGKSLYKERLMNRAALLASGSVAPSSWVAFRRGTRRRLRARIVNSPLLGGPARRTLNWLRGYRQ
jgi:CelD/BcsL family acetyltransferase involved in cellulose biosynthesis